MDTGGRYPVALICVEPQAFLNEGAQRQPRLGSTVADEHFAGPNRYTLQTANRRRRSTPKVAGDLVAQPNQLCRPTLGERIDSITATNSWCGAGTRTASAVGSRVATGDRRASDRGGPGPSLPADTRRPGTGPGLGHCLIRTPLAARVNGCSRRSVLQRSVNDCGLRRADHRRRGCPPDLAIMKPPGVWRPMPSAPALAQYEQPSVGRSECLALGRSMSGSEVGNLTRTTRWLAWSIPTRAIEPASRLNTGPHFSSCRIPNALTPSRRCDTLPFTSRHCALKLARHQPPSTSAPDRSPGLPRHLGFAETGFWAADGSSPWLGHSLPCHHDPCSKTSLQTH
ncbi:MAG: hypothetical protein JWN95_979 [Frankiales bacterium]|nr:hypothetical protein [Frankiales bacterium]